MLLIELFAEREGWNGLCRNIPQLSVSIGFKSLSALLLLHIILYHSAWFWVWFWVVQCRGRFNLYNLYLRWGCYRFHISLYFNSTISLITNIRDVLEMYWRYDVCKDKHFHHSDGDEHESLRHDVLRAFVRDKAGPNGWQGLEMTLS